MVEISDEIIVYIVGDGRNTVKVTWSHAGLCHLSYNLNISLLKEISEELRLILQYLIDEARKGNTLKYGSILKKLARKGHDLFGVLFHGNSSTDLFTSEEIKGWFKGFNQNKTRVIFSVDSNIYVPWGLIFDEPVTNDTIYDDVTDPVYNNFWCIKYSVVTQSNLLTPFGLRTVWPQKDFKLLFGAHKDKWDTAFNLIDSDEQVALKCLLDHPSQPKYSFSDLKDDWNNRPHGLFSLFCHSNGKRLVLGKKDSLSSERFAYDFKRSKGSDNIPPTFVFFAGCETAIGDNWKGFIAATSGPGFCGFIGTDAKVPDIFTLRFLTRFLHRFCTTGESVQKVIQGMRKEHFPLSLVFSIYCPPNIKMEPQKEHLMCQGCINNQVMNQVNLSYTRVASS